MIPVKNENGKFYYKSDGLGWRDLPEKLKNLKDVKEYFHSNDITLVTPTGETYRSVEVVSYDGLNLTLKEGENETKTYLPERSEKEICDYLMSEGSKLGYSQTVVRFNIPAKGPIIDSPK